MFFYLCFSFLKNTMSQALVKENLVKLTDPRVNLDKKINYVIEEGAQVISYIQSYTDGNVGSGSSFTFSNANPPGPGVIMDRKVMMQCTFRLTFSGYAAVGQRLVGFEPSGNSTNPIYQYTPAQAANYAGTPYIRASGTDAPRAFPLAQIMNSVSVTINNATVTQSLSDYIEPLLRYSTGRDADETAFSLTPSYQDQYQQYGDWLLHGDARNVLGDYGQQGYQTNRGGFSGLRWCSNPVSTDANTLMTAIFELTVNEPLFISPLDFSIPTVNHRGLIGIQNFYLTVNTIGKLSNIWSHDAVHGQNITNIDVVITSANQSLSKPMLQFTYMTPRILAKVPDINVYSYYFIDDFVTEFPGNSIPPCFPLSYIDAPITTLQSNNRQLSCVPKYIYIVVKQSNSTKNYNSTDTYAYIRSVSIDFNNNTNLLTSMTPQQLYNMSVKNGCNLSWSQWTRFVGSVICIDVAQDLNLAEDLLPGIRDGNLNFRVRCDVVNISGSAKEYAMYVLPSYPGLFNIGGNTSEIQTGIIDKKDILTVNNMQSIDYHEAYNFYGGKLDFRRLQEYGKKASKVLKTVSPLAKTIAPRLAPALDVSESLLDQLVSAGYTKKQARSVLDKMQGGMIEGGKKMKKSDMKKRLAY